MTRGQTNYHYRGDYYVGMEMGKSKKFINRKTRAKKSLRRKLWISKVWVFRGEKGGKGRRVSTSYFFVLQMNGEENTEGEAQQFWEAVTKEICLIYLYSFVGTYADWMNFWMKILGDDGADLRKEDYKDSKGKQKNHV